MTYSTAYGNALSTGVDGAGMSPVQQVLMKMTLGLLLLLLMPIMVILVLLLVGMLMGIPFQLMHMGCWPGDLPFCCLGLRCSFNC